MGTIDMIIECPACEGTGVYSGVAERKNTAVICNRCDGTGKYHYVFTYNKFTGRKEKHDIDRVYLKNYGYVLSTGKINFDGIGEIDMNKEGVSYQEFLDGKRPEHIRKFGCPMLIDQSACHKIKGFIDKCCDLNGS